jgi:hypothetical protein
MEAPSKLERKWIGTRVGFSLLTVAVFFGTMYALASYPELDQSSTWDVCKWVIGALAGAILGDTVRPSGQKGAAFGVTTAPGAPA